MSTKDIVIAAVAGVAVFLAGYVVAGDRNEVSGPRMMMGWRTMMSDGDFGFMTQMMDGMSGMLQGLEGDDLDRAFIGMMVPHHQGAIAMCQPILRGDGHVELKTLCRDIVASQSREISQMQAWHVQWFGR